MREYYAHTDGYEQPRQLLRDHSRNTAILAARALKSVGLEHTAYLAGLIHDLGKYTDCFQKYLLGEPQLQRGTVIHSFQACKLMMEQYHTEEVSNAVYFAAELISIAVGSHHGLFDCIDREKTIGLAYRASREDIGSEEAAAAFFSDCAARDEFEHLVQLSALELQQWLEQIDRKETSDSTEYAFSLGLLARLLTSAVMEGDRSDTARFMNGAVLTEYPEDMQPIWQERLEAVECRLAKLPGETKISAARHQISDQCRSSAEKAPGIYRLYVPTGGGKTLSALRYALAHAAKFHKKRLVFTSPLLSILEQNAAQIREYLNDDSLVLEHHSNVIQTEQESDALDQRELLVQSWGAPVIITTLVQLLNTMFDGKTTCVRRFHALCDSVIVIDEVQTVPEKLLSLFNRAIFFLSSYCGATVILSSATQPSLEKAEHPLRGEIGNIVPYDPVLWKLFSRTRIELLPAVREVLIPEQIRGIMEHTRSLLVVCNKKSEAARLVGQLKDESWAIYHLSAGMCVQHRRDVLREMAAQLEALRNRTSHGQEKKVLCISTQVIEAGVDISFDTALRFAAGMDSVVQTAGRCNRNGESDQMRPVYLVNCTDESLKNLPEIRRGKDAAVELLDEYAHNPQRFEENLASDEAIRFYYHSLYRSMDQGSQDYPVYASDNRPAGSLYEFLSTNEGFCSAAGENASAYLMCQAFKTAGKAFAVFDQETTDVLVPYGEGTALISALCSDRGMRDRDYREKLLRRANSFSISLYSYQKQKLEAGGALYPICENSIFVLRQDYYSDVIGLIDQSNSFSLLEV